MHTYFASYRASTVLAEIHGEVIITLREQIKTKDNLEEVRFAALQDLVSKGYQNAERFHISITSLTPLNSDEQADRWRA